MGCMTPGTPPEEYPNVVYYRSKEQYRGVCRVTAVTVQWINDRRFIALYALLVTHMSHAAQQMVVTPKLLRHSLRITFVVFSLYRKTAYVRHLHASTFDEHSSFWTVSFRGLTSNFDDEYAILFGQPNFIARNVICEMWNLQGSGSCDGLSQKPSIGESGKSDSARTKGFIEDPRNVSTNIVPFFWKPCHQSSQQAVQDLEYHRYCNPELEHYFELPVWILGFGLHVFSNTNFYPTWKVFLKVLKFIRTVAFSESSSKERLRSWWGASGGLSVLRACEFNNCVCWWVWKFWPVMLILTVRLGVIGPQSKRCPFRWRNLVVQCPNFGSLMSRMLRSVILVRFSVYILACGGIKKVLPSLKAPV